MSTSLEAVVPLACGDETRSVDVAEPINLNRARKARARAEDRARAQENRVRFGRTGAEKASARLEADRLARDVDGARRDGPKPAEDA